MTNNIFSADCKTEKELLISAGAPIADVARRLSSFVSEDANKKGDAVAQEIEDLFISDFEKDGDKIRLLV